MGCGPSCGMGITSTPSQRYASSSVVSSYVDRMKNISPQMISSGLGFDPRDSYQKQGSGMPYASIEHGHSAAYIKACDKDNRPAAAKYGNMAYWNVSGV